MPHQDFIGSDGKPWPSATELTSLLPQAWLWKWYKSSVQKKGYQGWLDNLNTSEEGKRLGTAVHAHLDALVQGAPEVTGEGADIAEALFDKSREVVKEWISPDVHVVCNEFKVHGATDGIVQLFDGSYVVLDWKTSYKKDDLAHPIQLSIYSAGWSEGDGPKVDKGLIIRVDKKSKRLNTQIDEYDNLNQYYPVIKALRTLWGYINER